MFLLSQLPPSFFFFPSPCLSICACVCKSMHHSPATCLSAGPVVSLSEWHLCSPVEPSGCVPHTCERNQPGFGSDSHQTASLPTHTSNKRTHTHTHLIQTAQIGQKPISDIYRIVWWHRNWCKYFNGLLTTSQLGFPIITMEDHWEPLHINLWTALDK